MKLTTTLAAIAFLLSPTLVLAQGCDKDRTEASLTCAAGTSWDAATKTCVVSTS